MREVGRGARILWQRSRGTNALKVYPLNGKLIFSLSYQSPRVGVEPFVVGLWIGEDDAFELKRALTSYFWPTPPESITEIDAVEVPPDSQEGS